MENKIFSAESLKFRGNIKYISRTLKLTITNFKYDCMMDLEKKKNLRCQVSPGHSLNSGVVSP